MIATHSPIIAGLHDAAIYSLSDSGITSVYYEETECYRGSRSSLMHASPVKPNRRRRASVNPMPGEPEAPNKCLRPVGYPMIAKVGILA